MTYQHAPLGDLASLQAGYGFPVELQGRTSGDYPFAKVGDISRCGRSTSTVLEHADHYVDADDLVALRAKPIPAGSVLFAKIGEAIRQNHRAIAGCDMLIDNNAMAAVPSTKIDGRFLYHFLKTVDFYRLAPATTVPALRKSDLEKLPTPCPPLPEQRRIAAILDKADALRTKRREALAQLDRLAQSIFVEMFGDPVTNPKGWPSKALGGLTTKMGSGSTPTGGDAAYKESGISLIRSMNVHDGCFVHKNLAHIDDEQAAKLKNVVVEADDVLLNITGASVARVCRAPRDVLPARVNQHVMIIRPSDELSSIFLERLLLNPSMKTLLLKVGGAGATREAITKADAEELSVIVPPKALQVEFERKSRQALKLQELHETELAGLEGLFASLQHRAFRGEL